jgi:hypothetical protein
MTRNHAVRLVHAVLEAVIVAHLVAVDAALDVDDDLSADLRAAIRAHEYHAGVAWYHAQRIAWDLWRTASDQFTIH